MLDFHSGGRTLEFLPFAAAHVLDDKMQEDRCFAAVKAFGAPYSMRMLEIDAVGMYDTAAESLGRVFVTTELGGGGTSTPAHGRHRPPRPRTISSSIAASSPARSTPAETVWLDMPSGDCFVFSRGRRRHRIAGRTRRPGEARPAAGAHLSVGRTGVAPIELSARMDGMLVARHFPGLVKTGDCAAVVAVVSE